jgi:ABC-type branched-subunit amino acid transport system ATPase component/MFS family permease
VSDLVEDARDESRAVAREAIGVTGQGEAPPLRAAIARSGVGWYPLVALGLLVVVDEFHTHAFFVLGPEISASLGVSKETLAFVVALKTIAVSVAILPMAAFVQHRPRRALLAIVTAFVWSAMTLFTSFVVTSLGLAMVMIADGLSTGSVRAVHPSVLVDTYPTEVRVRTLSFYRSADGLGNIAAPLLVGLLVAVLGYTWRGVFFAMGLMCFGAAIASLGLRDPGFGRWDTARVREALGGDETRGRDDVALGTFEIVRRLLLIPTVRRILAGQVALGMTVIPLFTFFFFYLQEEWGMGPGARAVFFACVPVFAVAALLLVGRRGEAVFRRDPARLVELSALCLGLGVTVLAVAVLQPFFAVMVVLFGIASAMFALQLPWLLMCKLSIVPPTMRPHAAALSGLAQAAMGGFGGLILLGGADRRFGAAGAIAALAIPGIVAAVVLRSARLTINQDLDRMLDGIIEDERISELRAQGIVPSLIACRHLDFAYSGVQVLFDVNMTVEEGEIVALLGTNGAGKSTLLKVISGIGLPSRGSVRFEGTDITFLDAERRLRLGIAQVPGGRAVFPSLSVADNLRMYGFSFGRDRQTVERGIEAALSAFPRLVERNAARAITLSGGEQQMLGLAKAFILRPRLLLIDELSLGLAPKVTAELLAMVRQINETGTAVVLVEQSVNVALSMASRAYFMEKGEIRFEGPSSELIGRTDLLRSVFLAGATRSLADGRAGKQPITAGSSR